jgi:hypothetical protein
MYLSVTAIVLGEVQARPDERLQGQPRGGPMRLISLVVTCGLLVACRHPIEVRGLYVSGDGAGYLFPCDQPTTMWGVSDSALATRYRLTATNPHQLLYVRLRGVEVDSGGIYGPMGHGGRHLLVRTILEIRARGTGECPGIAPAPPMLPVSQVRYPRRPA